MGLAKKAYQMGKFAVGVLNVEYKHHDVLQSPVSVYNAGWGIDALSLIAQGDDDTMREGRSSKLTALDIRMRVQSSTPSVPATFRLMLVRDNACVGAYPLISDLMDSTVGNDSVVNDFRNISTFPSGRYDVLYDHYYTFDPAQDTLKEIRIHKHLNQHLKFIGTTSGISSAGAGSLFLCYVSTGAAAGAGVSVSYQSRLRYIDN